MDCDNFLFETGNGWDIKQEKPLQALQIRLMSSDSTLIYWSCLIPNTAGANWEEQFPITGALTVAGLLISVTRA
jgi:hypothetical protein